MSLSERLSKVTQGPEPRCPVGKMLDRMPNVDRVAVEQAFRSEVASTTAISDSLRAEGWANDRTNLAKHRRGECRCVTE